MHMQRLKNIKVILTEIQNGISNRTMPANNLCTSKNKKTDTDFTTVFEKSQGLETATYEQTIEYYSDLADSYSEISMKAIGETDSGKPLHIVTLNPDGKFDFDSFRENKRIVLKCRIQSLVFYTCVDEQN